MIHFPWTRLSVDGAMPQLLALAVNISNVVLNAAF